MDILYLYNNVHSSSIFSLLFQKKKAIKQQQTKKLNIPMATISPAHTTTQLLISNTEPYILPQQIIDLSMLLQNNSKIPVLSSTGVGPLKLLSSSCHTPLKEIDPPAAQQPKRPAWTESHAYLRGSRTNSNYFRIISTEVNMIRASKITRSLRPRRSYLSRRQDEFIWGNPSTLRISQTSL